MYFELFLTLDSQLAVMFLGSSRGHAIPLASVSTPKSRLLLNNSQVSVRPPCSLLLPLTLPFHQLFLFVQNFKPPR